MTNPPSSLSKNDARVLNALFDAESSLSSGVAISNESIPAFATDIEIKQRESAAIIPLNSPQPSRPSVEKAIAELDGIINERPQYASAYANRAQANRLLLSAKSDDLAAMDLFSAKGVQLSQSILKDLTSAINMATPSPSAAVPTTDARLLSAAHTHRGYLLLQAAKSISTSSADSASVKLPESLRGLSSDTLEEMASMDFFWGGRYGNEVAKVLAVKTNPYAKMCGAIVKEALQEEMKQYQPTQ
ncbi:hypothetical protein P152DRAFT_239613 [Eremomyces bilateralis CBS 781.70]|uniref:Uncharacterized protein n=1 Tax=Eremomyces bilateralis CBS 781.70 TaxID=1392243 RepID=A0A6G1GAJ0_9PEZI|nr:uncharacterized protein P152DRAFT_239613 [Eremomyces bilateralis CBS 781.70]KAF1814956.1 hypothetical protein P152DRAFT_239613 [Eremomyces bilateralis CBS 781.70]